MSRIRLSLPSDLEDATRASVAEVEAIAADRMSRARIHILFDHPYFGSVLLQLPMRGTHDETAVATIATDGRRLLFNFKAIAALTTPDVRLLMMHVLTHVLLDHANRAQDREWKRWEVAADFATNALLEQMGLPIPSDWPCHRAWSNRSAEAIYDQLPKTCEEKTMLDSLIPLESERSACDAGVLKKCVAFDTAATGLESLSALHAKSIAKEFLEQIKQKFAGTGAGSNNNEIKASCKERVDWRRILAQFVVGGARRDYSTLRHNRKHLWRGIYLPSLVSSGAERIVVAIDTSGSMGRVELSAILTEVDALRRTEATELVVVQFDCSIQAVATFTPWQQVDAKLGSTSTMTMFGRGGTDICLPFTWVENERAKGRVVSALIVCTDGYGPLPPRAPNGLPVLFLLTPQNLTPKFGAVIVLD